MKKFLIGIFLISVFTLFFEIVMFKIITFLTYPYIALVVFSISILGIGVGGLFAYFLRNTKIVSEICILLGIMSLISVIIIVHIPLTYSTISNTIFYWIFLAIPFILVGYIISMIFIRNKEINQIYFFNLLGSATGIVLSICLLNMLGAESSLFVASMIAFLSTLCFSEKKCIKFLSVVLSCIFLLLIILNSNVKIFDIAAIYSHYSSYDSKLLFSKLKENPDSILYTKWNYNYRIDILYFYQQLCGTLNNKKIIVSNGNFMSIVINPYNYDIGEAVKKDARVIIYPFLPNNSKILIVGTGGGTDVYVATYLNHTVVGIEINSDVVKLIKNELKNYTDNVYGNKTDRKIIVIDGRSFIESIDEKYNLISLSLTDTAYTAPEFTNILAESYIYTKEGLNSFFSQLSDNGILYVGRFLKLNNENMPTELLKLVSIFSEILKEKNTTLDQSVIVFSNRIQFPTGVMVDTGDLLVKKNGFNENESNEIVKVIENSGATVLYAPYHKSNNSEVSVIFYNFITSKNYTEFYEYYPYDVKPSSDDKPYFYENDKNHSTAKEVFKSSIRFSSFFITIALILLFVKTKTEITKKINYSIYFLLLGFTYMCVTTMLMQKFTLIFGNPIYSFTIVLFSILILSGLGSIFSRSWGIKK